MFKIISLLSLCAVLILHGCGKKGKLDPPEWHKAQSTKELDEPLKQTQ